VPTSNGAAPGLGASGELSLANVAAVSPDSDGDTISDFAESGYACTALDIADGMLDYDADGALNIDEFAAGSDPCQSDTDSDGCSDGRESRLAEHFGGSRDSTDPWDFFDVTMDRRIDLGDTLAILTKFGVAISVAAYDGLYDRYSPDLAKPWRTAAAVDGNGIDLTDALTSLSSFGHDCTGTP
jgi:hypothetical protein